MDEGSRVWLDKLAGAHNYSQWKYDLENLLGEKDLLGHVDGTCVMPAAEGEVKAGSSEAEDPVKKWKMDDREAMGIVSRSLTAEYHAMIRDCGSAKEVWERIKSEFESSTESSVTDAWISLISVTFESSDRVASFVSKLNCACEKMKVHKKHVDEGLKKGLLMKALPSSFSVFRETYAGLQNAEQLDKITYAKLCTMAKEAEGRILQNHGRADHGAKTALPKNDICAAAQNHGRSKNIQNRFGGGSDSKKGAGCFECGGPHFKRDCPKLVNGDSGASKGNNNKFKRQEKNQTAEGRVAKETAGMFCLTAGHGKRGWYLDSGASKHMTKHRSWFSKYKELNSPIPVTIGDDKVVHATRMGDVPCDMFDCKSWNRGQLQDVLHIPDFGETNLVSMGQILDRDFRVEVTKGSVRVLKSGVTVSVGHQDKGQLFQMEIRNEGPSDRTVPETGFVSLQTWHERFAHADPKKIKALEGTGVVSGLKIDSSEEFVCHGCSLGKMTQQPSSLSRTGESAKQDNVFTRICFTLKFLLMVATIMFLWWWMKPLGTNTHRS